MPTWHFTDSESGQLCYSGEVTKAKYSPTQSNNTASRAPPAGREAQLLTTALFKLWGTLNIMVATLTAGSLLLFL